MAGNTIAMGLIIASAHVAECLLLAHRVRLPISETGLLPGAKRNSPGTGETNAIDPFKTSWRARNLSDYRHIVDVHTCPKASAESQAAHRKAYGQMIVLSFHPAKQRAAGNVALKEDRHDYRRNDHEEEDDGFPPHLGKHR